MTLTRDAFVALVGGLALTLAVAGWVLVEVRSGPFEHPVSSPGSTATLEGTYRASPASTAGGLEEPCRTTVEPACQQPRTQLDLRVVGLPSLGDAMVYAGFLVGPDRSVPVGPLERGDGAHTVSFDGNVSGEGLKTLAIKVGLADSTGEPSPFLVHEVPLPGEGESPELQDRFEASLGPVGGRLEVAQVGAVEVSTSAHARLENLPRHPGWTYRGWFVDEDAHAVTRLGELDASGDQTVLDVRVERVVLADQDRLVVTLVPGFLDPSGESLQGFPVVDVPLGTAPGFG